MPIQQQPELDDKTRRLRALSDLATEKSPALLASQEDFAPPFWGRSALLQTVLAQSGLRRLGRNEAVRRARGELLRLANDVTLQGFYSPHPAGSARGLAVLLSGWGGHAGATYIVRTAKTLFDHGYDVFRLNYRDHGGTHDLNEGFFHFDVLDEVQEALQRIVANIRTRPVFLVGFSMGGNFALNIACRGLLGLRGVVAVSPPLRLLESLRVLESHRFFHYFFLRDWQQSLFRKEVLYPYRYDFTELRQARSIGTMAQDLVSRYVGQRSWRDYSSPLDLTPEKLRELKTPANLIASIDDPVVGQVDYETFRSNPKLTLHISAYGGHVGFLTSLFGPAWYEGRILELLEPEVGGEEA